MGGEPLPHLLRGCQDGSKSLIISKVSQTDIFGSSATWNPIYLLKDN
jgi:hypothetical protein